MNKSKIKVIVTRKLPLKVEERLGALFNVELNSSDTPFTHAQLLDAMNRADVLVPTLNDKINAELIAQANGKLKLLANYGSGTDHIDVEAAHKAGISVSNSPALSSADASDMAIALILTVMRRLKEGATVMESGDWTGWAPSAFLGTRLRGKTLGILGLGRIGVGLAERAKIFGLDVAYHNRKPIHPDTAERLDAIYYDSFEALLPNVDILAICAPLSDDTREVLNAKTIKLMRQSAFVINISRGGLINEDDLADALTKGRLAGAGLDVLATTAHVNPALVELPNVILLPHMGSATLEAREEMGETVIRNIKMHEDGHRPPNLVIPNL